MLRERHEERKICLVHISWRGEHAHIVAETKGGAMRALRAFFDDTSLAADMPPALAKALAEGTRYSGDDDIDLWIDLHELTLLD